MRQPAARGRYHRVRRDFSPLDCLSDGEGLERGARLEAVGDDAVAQLRAGQTAAIIGVVRRQIGERQHLAGLGVEHDDGACLGLAAVHRQLQLGEGESLQFRIQRKRQVAAVLRLADRFRILDDLPETVLDHPPAAGLAGQRRLVSELDAFLARVVRAGEAEHLRHHFAVRDSSGGIRGSGTGPVCAGRSRAAATSGEIWRLM